MAKSVGPPKPAATAELYDALFGPRDQTFALQRLGGGIVGVLEHVRALLEEVDLLLDAGRSARAHFLLTTADEELGKAHILVDMARLDVTKHQSLLGHLCRAFYSHVCKYAYSQAWWHRHVGTMSIAELRGRLFSCDLVEYWPGGGPESGEPDLPHNLVFNREHNLYVDYRVDWLVPDADRERWRFRPDSTIDDPRQFSREHLASFVALRDAGAFALPALEAFNRLWRAKAVTAATPDDVVTALREQAAMKVAARIGWSPDAVLVSPLGFWPHYLFLESPTQLD